MKKDHSPRITVPSFSLSALSTLALLLTPLAVHANSGSIKICRVIVSDQNEIATQNAGLPEGTFTVDLSYRKEAASSLIALIPLKFTASQFAPNAKALSENISKNIECVTYDNLAWGYYYYGTEKIEGSSAWQHTLYNDQYRTPVNSLVNFYEFDEEQNEDADGVIIIGASRPERTLILLNRYEMPSANSAEASGGGSASFAAASVNFGNGGGGSAGSGGGGGTVLTILENSDNQVTGNAQDGDGSPDETPAAESVVPSVESASFSPNFSENIDPDTSHFPNSFGFDFSFLKYLWLILFILLALFVLSRLLRATEEIEVAKQNSDTN